MTGKHELLGRTIAGKFVVEEILGEGAMATVFRARHRELDKAIALKVMHRSLAIDPTFAARFHREAKAASRLDHPCSIRILDHGQEEDDLCYIAMELVQGRDLHRIILDEWPLGDDRVVSILSQVLAAVAVAHDMGIIHRDLKPENIMVERGPDDEGQLVDRVKVCDFGIAKIADARSDKDGDKAPSITGTGFVVGTPEYMAPEQARGQAIDARADVYAVGAILYRLLARVPPFQAESALGVAVKHIFEDPPPPSARAQGVNPRLEAICLKAMKKAPGDRWQTAREMRAALAGKEAVMTKAPVPGPVTSGSAPAPQPEPAPTITAPVSKSAAPPQRSPSFLWAVPIALVAFLIAFGISRTTSQQRAASAPPTPPTPLPMASEPVAPPPVTRDSTEPVVTVDSTSTTPAPPRSTLPRTPRVTGEPPAPPLPPSPPPVQAPPTIAAPEPPAPSAVPPPPVPPPPSPPPPPPAVTPAAVVHDVSSARVSLGSVTTTNGLSIASVRSALGHVSFARCYQDALRASGTAATGTARLHLSIDDSGYVTSASVSIGFLPGARACIEGAARGIRVPNVDTGDATADASLTFSVD